MKLHFKFFFSVILLIYSNFSFSQGGCIGGTVTTLSPTVNYGNNTTLTLNVPTGSFLWQYSSDNSNWQNVSGGSVININNTATSTTSSFSYTGALQTFEVPAGVTSINADGIGAAGGHGYSDYYGNGGKGGRLVADLNTTPSETLNIFIGERGHNSGVGNILLMTFTPSDGKGGYNGGGNSPTDGSGGGGGATDIRQGGINLSNRIFVVGAGGGGGQQRRTGEPGGNGGAGGGNIGQNGFRSNNGTGSYGGYGGTQLEGGAIGGNDDATPGQFGIGGNGGRYQGISDNRTGGSGGAGFYGGGGGENGNGSSGGGGGGGSSYSSGTITTNTQEDPSATGDGSLILSYTIPASVTSSYTTSLTSPTYFRAVVTDGACVAYSTSSFISVNPNLIITSPIATLTSCLGTASSNTTFGVTGSNLTASVTITAPSNFEISTNSGGTYSSSITLTNLSTVSQTVYLRLNQSATAGSKTGTITATSTGASDATTYVSGTVNSLPNIGISGTTTDVELVTLTASGGSTYTWSDGSSTSSATNTFDASGSYTLTVTDAFGCISSTNLNIAVQHWGLSRTGEKILDSASQINANGQIGSLNPISQEGKKREYKSSSSFVRDGLVLNLDAGNTFSYPGTGTTWTDLSGSNNGSMTDVTYTASPGYFNFNGSSSKIAFSSGITSGDNLTYETWVNLTSIGGYSVIANSNNWSTGYVHFQFHSSYPSFDLNGGGDQTSSASFSVNTWYNLVTVYSKSNKTVSFYVNGVLIDTKNISESPPSIANTPFTIGAWENDRFFNGKISIFRAYNIAFDATQVQRNYNVLKSRFGL